jgi:dipeptidyl aminopeptidase/acylaminoacyl peptidase
MTMPNGETVSGTLQLPVGRAPNDRHPVIIWAYPDQAAVLNGSLTRLNNLHALWFPFQFLLTKGFAFFHAPFPTTGKRRPEPLQMAVDAIEPWLDVLNKQPEILPGEFGFFGHSNAGYAALALEVLSKRFKAIVACSTFPDLGFGLFYTNGMTAAADCSGNLTQAYRFPYEDPVGPYFMNGPAWKGQDKYLRNAPLFHLDTAATPLLLIEGEFDAAPRAMEATYSVLHGRGVPVELAYYWGESHVFSSPGNILDTWTRSEKFFGKYLQRR